MSKKNGDTLPVFLRTQSLVPQDSDGEETYPVLSQCLMPRWRDGRCIRESGRIGIRIVGSYYMATVTCPSEGLECSVSCSSIIGLMDRIEQAVASPDTVWTPTYGAQKRARQDAQRRV
jgi:hypothetical protein